MIKAAKNGSGGFHLTRYMHDRKERLEDEAIGNYAVFGQLGGLIISLMCFMKWLTTYNTLMSYILLALTAFGLYMMITGVIVPQSLNWIYRPFSIFGNKIGEIIFDVLLLIVYFVFVLPVGLFMRRKNHEYLYAEWDDKYPFDERSGFTVWKSSASSSKGGMLGTSARIIQMLMMNGKYIFIPAVIILIALGIILFFVSSSVMAPFIYTLF